MKKKSIRDRIEGFGIVPATLLLVLSTVVFAGCLDVLTSEVKFGDEFVLDVDKQAIVGDAVNVQFLDVVNEGRCPSDAVCVWEGDAEVILEVKPTGATPRRVSVHTHTSLGKQVVVDGFVITLIELTPLPTTAGPPNRSDYDVRLVVERK